MHSHGGCWPFALATTPAHNVMSVCITASGPGMSLHDCESVRENSVCSASRSVSIGYFAFSNQRTWMDASLL